MANCVGMQDEPGTSSSSVVLEVAVSFIVLVLEIRIRRYDEAEVGWRVYMAKSYRGVKRTLVNVTGNWQGSC